MRRLAVFLTGSGMGAVIDYLITLFLAGRLGPELSLALAMAFSSSLVFLYHQRITFADLSHDQGTTQTTARRWFRFVLLAVMVYILRAVILRGGLIIGMRLDIALILAILIASGVNYLLSRFVIFIR